MILPSTTHLCNYHQSLPISSAQLPLPPNEAQVGHLTSFSPVPLKKCWWLTSKGELHWNNGKESLEVLSHVEKPHGIKDGAILSELAVGQPSQAVSCVAGVNKAKSIVSSGHWIQLQ